MKPIIAVIFIVLWIVVTIFTLQMFDKNLDKMKNDYTKSLNSRKLK